MRLEEIQSGNKYYKYISFTDACNMVLDVNTILYRCNIWHDIDMDRSAIRVHTDTFNLINSYLDGDGYAELTLEEFLNKTYGH